jgi:hypothetical protein
VSGETDAVAVSVMFRRYGWMPPAAAEEPSPTVEQESARRWLIGRSDNDPAEKGPAKAAAES